MLFYASLTFDLFIPLCWSVGQTEGTGASLPPNEWAHSVFGRDVHHDEWLLAGLLVVI